MAQAVSNSTSTPPLRWQAGYAEGITGPTASVWMDLPGWDHDEFYPIACSGGEYPYGASVVAVVPKLDPQWKRHADLIAAAPDMLAALKELLEDPNYQIAIGGNPHAVQAMLARAQAAIAKAEGR